MRFFVRLVPFVESPLVSRRNCSWQPLVRNNIYCLATVVFCECTQLCSSNAFHHADNWYTVVSRSRSKLSHIVHSSHILVNTDHRRLNGMIWLTVPVLRVGSPALHNQRAFTYLTKNVRIV